MGKRQVGKSHVVGVELGVLVERLSRHEGSEIPVGNHGAFRWPSCTRSVGESKAVFRVDFVLLVVVVKSVFLSDFIKSLKGDESHSSLFEIVHLVLGELVKADQGVDLHEIFALGEGLEGAVVDEASGELGVLENVSDVLVAKGIVDGDRGESEEAGGHIADGPLLPVLGEDAEHLQLLSFGLAEQLLQHDGAADLMRPL